MIYLDHNATAPLDPCAAAAMAECLAAAPANPASQHAAGRKARQRLEDARDGLSTLLGLRGSGGRGDRIVFTSGGTEANNLAIFGLARGGAGRIVSSWLEHPSVLGPLRRLADQGWQIDWARITPDGVVDVEHVRSLLRPDVRFATFMLANNETGVLQPIEQIAELCRRQQIPLHVDAVQAVGKIDVDFAALGIESMSCAAHKFHGPQGVGALILAKGVEIDPLLFGGFQQAGLRPGSECTALAVAMHAALASWHADRGAIRERLTGLRDQLEGALAAAGLNIEIHGRRVARLPQTSNVAFLGFDRQALTMALDLAGVACSTGSACASGSSEPSPALVAMGCSAEALAGSIRFSLGRQTTAAEVAEAGRRIVKVCDDLQRAKNPGKNSSADR